MNSKSWKVISHGFFTIAEMIQDCNYNPDRKLLLATKKLIEKTLDDIKKETVKYESTTSNNSRSL